MHASSQSTGKARKNLRGTAISCLLTATTATQEQEMEGLQRRVQEMEESAASLLIILYS